jgi:hypothetical protein
MTTANTQPKTSRATEALLVIIVLVVGTMAGAASFRHVHDWTLDHSPTGTASWLGWANAVITELVPTAALIVIARRRKSGTPIGYPIFLLIVAVGFSLTAQLAVAEYSTFGWMVSALPSLAFFALSKLVFSATKHASTTTPTLPAAELAAVEVARWDELVARIAHLESRPTTTVPARKPSAASARASSSSTAGTGKATQAADSSTTKARTPRKRTNPATTPTPTATPSTAPAPAPATVTVVTEPVPTSVETTSEGMDDLLPTARLYADSHHRTTGELIKPNELAVRMKIPTRTATRLLRAIHGIDTATYSDTPALTGPHNGSRPLQDVTA